MITSLQWPLSSVPKLAIVGRFKFNPYNLCENLPLTLRPNVGSETDAY